MASLYLDVSKNSGTPKTIHFNRVFHYKPSILGYPYFWKHPFISGDIFQERRHFQAEKLPNDFETVKLSIFRWRPGQTVQPPSHKSLNSYVLPSTRRSTSTPYKFYVGYFRGGMACSVVVRVVHSKVALPAMGLGMYWRDQLPSFRCFLFEDHLDFVIYMNYMITCVNISFWMYNSVSFQIIIAFPSNIAHLFLNVNISMYVSTYWTEQTLLSCFSICYIVRGACGVIFCMGRANFLGGCFSKAGKFGSWEIWQKATLPGVTS